MKTQVFHINVEPVKIIQTTFMLGNNCFLYHTADLTLLRTNCNPKMKLFVQICIEMCSIYVHTTVSLGSSSDDMSRTALRASVYS